jgi:hypothetical protein
MKKVRSIAIIVVAVSAAAAVFSSQTVAESAAPGNSQATTPVNAQGTTPANAQGPSQTNAQGKQPKRVRTAKKKPAKPVAATPVDPTEPSLQAAQIEQKCLRALNGECTNPISVEQARLRAEIIPAVTLSYLGTPAGTIGGNYIPFERLFQDNTFLFGLPTSSLTLACCIVRSK